MSLEPYLTFNGNCREAFDFYKTIFGGDYVNLMTFRDGPEDDDWQVPEEDLDLIMHVGLPIGSSCLMGSDTSSGFGPPATGGNNVAISFSADSRAHADQVFAGLADGGEVKMPMSDMFWGDYFGSLTDKYGFHWQVLFSSGG